MLNRYSVRYQLPNQYGGMDTKERIILTDSPDTAIRYVKDTMPHSDTYQNYTAQIIVDKE